MKTIEKCSFCGRTVEQVERIFASRKGCGICNYCVKEAKSVLDAARHIKNHKAFYIRNPETNNVS